MISDDRVSCMLKHIDGVWLTAFSCELGDGYRAVIGEQTSIQSLLGIGARISEYQVVCSVAGFKRNRSIRVVLRKLFTAPGIFEL